MAFKDAADALTRGDAEAVERLLGDGPELAKEEDVYDEVMESVDEPCSIKMAPVIGTLLSLAVKYGRVGSARLLLDRGAEVEALETIYWHGSPAESRTALYVAVWAGDADMVRLLLERSAEADRPSGPAASPATPLEEASYRGLADVVRLLLEARANAAPEGQEGRLLCRAVQGQHREVVELLLEHGAKANQEGADGLSPLLMAARRNCPEIAKLLLEKGASASQEPLSSMSLLAVASNAKAHWEEYVESATPGLERDWRAQMREDHHRLVQLLLDSGALKVAPGSLEHVVALFQQFDRNGDGVIQRQELTEVLRLLDGDDWTDERIDELVVAADANRDGKIDFDEFLKWVFHGSEQAAAQQPAAPAATT